MGNWFNNLSSLMSRNLTSSANDASFAVMNANRENRLMPNPGHSTVIRDKPGVKRPNMADQLSAGDVLIQADIKNNDARKKIISNQGTASTFGLRQNSTLSRILQR